MKSRLLTVGVVLLLAGVAAGGTVIASSVYGLRLIPQSSAPPNCTASGGRICLWANSADNNLYWQNASGTNINISTGSAIQGWFNAKSFGATGDGVTDDTAAIQSAIAAATSGATVYFPASATPYLVSGGFVVNKPIRIMGDGRASMIKMTGIAGSSVLFYVGGAVPNGSPRPDFAAGTAFTFTGALTSGQTLITGIGSTTGLSVNDDIFLSLGQDPNDACQFAFRQWNRVHALTMTSVTLEVPIPEVVSGSFPGGCTSPGNITTHVIYKYTTNPDGFEIGNLAIQQVSGPAYDVTVFAERARHVYIHDLFLMDAFQTVGAGSAIEIGESENATVERVYGDHAGGIGVYGSRGVSARDFVLRQIPSSAVYLESQNRNFTAENFVVESGFEHGTQQIIFDDGNSQDVHLKNFTFNNSPVNNNFLTFALGTLTDPHSMVTEDFYFYGPITQVNSFPLQQHRGVLAINGTVYRETKRVHQVIPLLVNQGAGAVVTLAKGLIRNMRVMASTTTGLTVVRFRDEVSLSEQPLYDPGNSVNCLPGGVAGAYGYPTCSALWTTGNSYPWNISPNMHSVHYFTGATPAGASLTVDLDMFVLADDGASGAGVENSFPTGIITSGHVLVSPTAPMISSGFGTGASVTASNGSAAFTINVGTGGTASTGVVGLPATATTGWACTCSDMTTQSSTVFACKQTGATASTVSIGNFNTAGSAAAWAASDVLVLSCLAY